MHDELLVLLKAVIGSTDLEDMTDEQIEFALNLAYNDVVLRTGEEVVERYKYNIIEGAKWYLARIGVEGETQHIENGVSRTFASTEKPSWLSTIVPYVTVKKNGATR